MTTIKVQSNAAQAVQTAYEQLKNAAMSGKGISAKEFQDIAKTTALSTPDYDGVLRQATHEALGLCWKKDAKKMADVVVGTGQGGVPVLSLLGGKVSKVALVVAPKEAKAQLAQMNDAYDVEGSVLVHGDPELYLQDVEGLGARAQSMLEGVLKHLDATATVYPSHGAGESELSALKIVRDDAKRILGYEIQVRREVDPMSDTHQDFDFNSEFRAMTLSRDGQVLFDSGWAHNDEQLLSKVFLNGQRVAQAD